MILCMPSTYLSDRQIRCLSKLLGPVAVCQPAEGIAPESMRAWADRGLLTFLVPQGIDTARLQRVMVEHRQWAQLHAGQLWDMAAAAIAANGRPPFMEETAVAQLTTSIRHYGSRPPVTADDTLLQAALFLAVCQEYDQQQEAVDSNLASVHSLESAMFARLSGEETDSTGGVPSSAAWPAADALSPEMIERRLRGWAILTRRTATPPDAMITFSAPVFDTLLERFGEALPLGTCVADSATTRAAWPTILSDIAAATDPIAAARRLLPVDTRSAAAASTLALAVVPGCPPARFLAELCAGAQSDAVTLLPDWSGPNHTVIGWAAFQED